ncbi:histidinol-phosphatase HisJ [Paenibacillus sp. PL91]|uniref:histidinol-phosphatase HisJ n=1 Tax=Paenibacillus sp. PL91 TaxID=2729538 RepID=UPI00145F2C36|nr:histidinol-phosphatase HisJ [Paenibacillus sp. PL91]MBC9200377.1 histidinol-phosphatase HisJ [Paenibacillus sp. PL91]
MQLKWDGHTHTNFCRHGSSANMDLYLEQAVRLGFQRYTFSEHPPLPAGYIDDLPLMAQLAMKEEELPLYFEQARQAKARYEGRIEAAVGLELDFLPEDPDFALRLVDKYGEQLEDVVFSVHYLPGIGGNQCIDYTPETFQTKLIQYYGSMDKVAEEYYNHVEAAIEWASKLPCRKRIGHINLIEKFHLALPELDETLVKRRLNGILPKLEAAGAGVDVNTAGFRKPTCGKAYVPEWFILECLKRGIPLVYGSDSHKPDEVGAGWDWFERTLNEARKEISRNLEKR